MERDVFFTVYRIWRKNANGAPLPDYPWISFNMRRTLGKSSRYVTQNQGSFEATTRTRISPSFERSLIAFGRKNSRSKAFGSSKNASNFASSMGTNRSSKPKKFTDTSVFGGNSVPRAGFQTFPFGRSEIPPHSTILSR